MQLKISILFFFFFLFQVATFAQIKNLGERGMPSERGSGSENTSSEERKSGRVNGDTIPSHIKAWIFQDRLLHNKTLALDTNITNFHIYDKVLRNNTSSVRTGNIGLASKSNDFFKSLASSEYIFLNPVKEYLFSNESMKFFHTNLPFTYIFHSSGSKQLNEQILNILHTQNISPKLNVGFRYDVINAEGQMVNNTTNINSAALWTSYLSERYNLQSNFVLNKIKNKENGGISDVNFVPNAELDPVNLENAKVQMNNLGFMLHQKYKLGINKITEQTLEQEEARDSTIYDTLFIPYISLNHTLKLNRSYRNYSDNGNASNVFYPLGTDLVNTYDSTILLKIENTFQIQFNENQQAKFKFRARAFARNEVLKYGSNWGGDLPTGYMLNADYLSREKVESFSNTSIGGALFDYSSKKWNWNFEGELFLMGRRTGDVELAGDLERIFSTKTDSFIVSIHGSFKNRTPFYLYEHFNSNHYNWYNQFNNENQMLAAFKLKYPRFKLKTKLQLASIDNFIYFGSDATPAQASQNINIISATIKKNIKFGAFSWNNEVVYQLLSDKKILQMPDLMYNTQLYADFFLFKKALKLQAGVEMQFTSEYNLPAYSPVLGQFYVNTQTPTNGLIPATGGNYPLLSGFVNFQIKKVLLFINFRNVTYLLDKTHNYSSYLYPIEKMTFHWGIRWRFYN